MTTKKPKLPVLHRSVERRLRRYYHRRGAELHRAVERSTVNKDTVLEAGTYYVVKNGSIDRYNLDLEAHARELGLLKSYEELV